MSTQTQHTPGLRATVWNEHNEFVGSISVTAEELNHFSNTGSVAAKVALCEDDLRLFELHPDDFVYIRIP